MFELDYSDPETHRILAKYQDITAQFERAAAEIEIEYQETGKAIVAEHEKLIEQNKEFYEQLEQAEQQAKEEEAAKSPWTAPREKETTISFGEFDDEHKAENWSSPTPPMGFPPPPPIPEPVPEPEQFRTAVPDPVMRFGEFDEEEPRPAPRAPQPPPAGRRRLREDDDDDMSGQSWLS